MPVPLVSVLTTAYNREEYLPECIESVLASTFRDYENIIVDDCSADKSYEIALAYAKKDPRIRVYRNEKNIGDYPNRNCAAGYAKGRYLNFIDADDYVYPQGLSVIVDMMERFPEAALGFASLEQDRQKPFPFQLSPREVYLRHYFDKEVFHKAPLSVIIRTDAFRAVGGFTGKRMVGDFEMWHIMAARYPVVLMPEGVVWYREHSEQEMQHYRMDARFPFAYLVIATQQLRSQYCPLLPDETDRAVRFVRRVQARNILRTVARRQLRVAQELFRQSGLTVGRLLISAFANLPKL